MVSMTMGTTEPAPQGLPVRYHSPGAHAKVRHGWLTGSETAEAVELMLVGETKTRWIPRAELAFVEALH